MSQILQLLRISKSVENDKEASLGEDSKELSKNSFLAVKALRGVAMEIEGNCLNFNSTRALKRHVNQEISRELESEHRSLKFYIKHYGFDFILYISAIGAMVLGLTFAF